jgi:hypothetical protein
MNEEDIQEWFYSARDNGGRGMTVKCWKDHWEVLVFDLEDDYNAEEGFGDTLLEAISDAIEAYQRNDTT